MQTFRQQCGDLEQKVAVFMQEKEQFENEVRMVILFHTALSWQLTKYICTVCLECRTAITRDIVNVNEWFLMGSLTVFCPRAK